MDLLEKDLVSLERGGKERLKTEKLKTDGVLPHVRRPRGNAGPRFRYSPQARLRRIGGRGARGMPRLGGAKRWLRGG